MKVWKIVLISVASTLATIGLIVGVIYLFFSGNNGGILSPSVPKELSATWKYKSSTYKFQDEITNENDGSESVVEHPIKTREIVVKKSEVNVDGSFGDWSLFEKDKMLLVLYPSYIFNTNGFGMVCFSENNNELKQVKCSSELIDKVNNHELKDSYKILEVDMYEITYEKVSK